MPNEEKNAAKISRRTFLGGAAALGGVLGAGALTAAASGEPVTTIAGTTQDAAGFQLPVKYVDESTYTRDIVGEITRPDGREVLPGKWLKKGSKEYIDYYSRYPEKEQYYDALSKEDDDAYGRQRDAHDWANHILKSTPFQACFMFLGGNATKGGVNPEVTEMTPEQASEKIKGLCKTVGADLVGIGPCRTEWLYTHDYFNREPVPETETYKYQISIACPNIYDLVATGTDKTEGFAVGVRYAQMAFMADMVALYIRNLGYRARANRFGDYIGLCVPMAVDAGLGEMGRNGFLVTKEFGTNLRLANILTDMPMKLDKPVDIGVQDFCEKCKLCGEWCPSGSISMGEKVEVRGIKKWAINPDSCQAYQTTNGEGSCGLCMVNCPWSKPPSWIHSMAVESATHSSIARSLLPSMEKVVYGKWVNHEPPQWITNTRKPKGA